MMYLIAALEVYSPNPTNFNDIVHSSPLTKSSWADSPSPIITLIPVKWSFIGGVRSLIDLYEDPDL